MIICDGDGEVDSDRASRLLRHFHVARVPFGEAWLVMQRSELAISSLPAPRPCSWRRAAEAEVQAE